MWEISGLLSLLEVDWVLGWTWIAWSCWGTPAPGDTQRAYSHYSKSSNTPTQGIAVVAVGEWGVQQWGWHMVALAAEALAVILAEGEEVAAQVALVI